MSEEQEGFFVGIHNPIDVRRNTLECSREIIQNLQSYENVKKIREVKIKRIQQLKTVIRELDLLFAKLRSTLPKTHLRATVEVEPESRLRTKKYNLKDMNELEKLNTQLREIEQEIARIS